MTIKFACGEHQPVCVACYKYQRKDGKAIPKEKVNDIQLPSDHGTERSLRLLFTRRQQSGTYEVIIETLPHSPNITVLERPTVTMKFEVKMQGQSPLLCST